MFALVLIAAIAQPCGGNLNQMELDQCWLKQADIAQTVLDAAYANVKATMAKLGIAEETVWRVK